MERTHIQSVPTVKFVEITIKKEIFVCLSVHAFWAVTFVKISQLPRNFNLLLSNTNVLYKPNIIVILHMQGNTGTVAPSKEKMS